MKRQRLSFSGVMLYCGLKREEYAQVRDHIHRRNARILQITSLLCLLLGLGFFLINLLLRTGMVVPYLFLAWSSLAVLLLQLLPIRRSGWYLLLCYVLMVAVFIYAFILSTQPANRAVPATSMIVFLVLFPLTTDDRPLRMCGVVALFAAAYLVYSHLYKDPAVFRPDVMNTVTFSLLGMLMYTIICTRNVREIWESRRVEKLQNDVITSLAMVIEERDESTGGHIRRTETYVRKLLERMRDSRAYPQLTEEYITFIRRAAALHDIGKIKVPDVILNKPGKLTPEEYEIIKQHAAEGADIIDRTMRTVEEEDFFNVARNIALCHHERYDGTGYPSGLAGEAIPLEARVMALADVYDALVSERVYKKAMSRQQAAEIIRQGRGTQFDPGLTDLFLACLEAE